MIKKKKIFNSKKKKVAHPLILPNPKYLIALKGCPQKRAKVGTFKPALKPRKPNSANRKGFWVKFINKHPHYQKRYRSIAYLRGTSTIWENKLKIKKDPRQGLIEKRDILIRGGRTKDLPGIKYKLIHGAKWRKNYPSLEGPEHYQHARSTFGLKRLIMKKQRIKNKYKDNHYYT